MPTITSAEPACEIVREELYLPMTDGTLLHAVTARPCGEGPFPVIVGYGAYGTGLDLHFVRNGYAYVSVAERGSECSGGTLDPLSSQTARDGAEVVEWAGSRPWSNGKVGMHGNSYYSVIQWLVAAEQPSHLATISPFHTAGDAYRDFFVPGGIPSSTGILWSFAAQPQNASTSTRNRLEAGDGTCASNQRDRPSNVMPSWGFVTTTNALDGPWYWQRSPLRVTDEIRIPVLMGHAFQDEQLAARGVFDVFRALDVPKKLVVTNGVHPTPKQVFLDTELRWFDYWLKGADNGILDEPAVTVGFETSNTTHQPNFARTYDAWPPAETTYVPFYLRSGGTMSRTPPEEADLPDLYVYPFGAETVRFGPYGFLPRIGGLTYETEPFSADTLIVGHPALILHAGSTAPDTDIYVLVSEIDSDGVQTFVQKGMLRASHRRIDPARSTPERPHHLHTAAEPLTPGEVYELAIEIFAVGQAFRAGSRLRIDILPPVPAWSEPLWTYQSTPFPGVNLVFHTPDRPSALLLPVVPTGGALPPAPPCPSPTFGGFAASVRSAGQMCRPNRLGSGQS